MARRNISKRTLGFNSSLFPSRTQYGRQSGIEERARSLMRKNQNNSKQSYSSFSRNYKRIVKARNNMLSRLGAVAG